jgi:hypothetical protein
MHALILAAALAATPAAWTLTPDGLGPVKIGMTEAQAAAALGRKLDADRPPATADAQEQADYRGCHEAEVHGLKGLYVMIENGRVTRVVVTEGAGAFRTATGVGLGDPESKVRKLYARGLKVEPKAYEGLPAHDLTAWNKAAKRGVRFSTDAHGKITDIFVGGESISYSEGCA